MCIRKQVDILYNIYEVVCIPLTFAIISMAFPGADPAPHRGLLPRGARERSRGPGALDGVALALQLPHRGHGMVVARGGVIGWLTIDFMVGSWQFRVWECSELFLLSRSRRDSFLWSFSGDSEPKAPRLIMSDSSDESDEWHHRRSGAEKRGPRRPSLEEVLRLVDDPSKVEDRLGMTKDQRKRCDKLLTGLAHVACEALTEEDCEVAAYYIGGSYGKKTALNYKFDADIVVILEDFDVDEAHEAEQERRLNWYQDVVLDGLQENFRRRIQFRERTPYCLKLTAGEFCLIDLLITGDPPQRMRNGLKRWYSSAGSSQVDHELNCFAQDHPVFRAFVLLVKHWRNLMNLPRGVQNISSYHLELLCMEVICQSQNEDSIRDLFRELLERLVKEDTEVTNLNEFGRNLLCRKNLTEYLAEYASETLQRFRRHLRPGNRAACPLCRQHRFTSGSGAVAHIESGSCEKCRGPQNAQKQIYNFMSGHQQTQQYMTPMLTDGYGRESGDQPYWCKQCQRTFTKLSSLMQHMQDMHGKSLKGLKALTS